MSIVLASFSKKRHIKTPFFDIFGVFINRDGNLFTEMFFEKLYFRNFR